MNKRILPGRLLLLPLIGYLCITFLSLSLLSDAWAKPWERSTNVDDILATGMEKIWREGHETLAKGNLREVEGILHRMILYQNQTGERVYPEVARLLVESGEQVLEREGPERRGDLALAFAQTAQRLNPYLAVAYNLQAKAVLAGSFTRLPDAALLYLQGQWNAAQEFWTLFYAIGRFFIIFFWAAAVTSLVYGLVLILRTMPHYFHLFRELTFNFSPVVQGSLWILLIVLSLTVRLGWVLLIWVALAWLYMARRERFLAAIVVTYLFLIPWLAPEVLFLYQAGLNDDLRSFVAAREQTSVKLFPDEQSMSDGGISDVRQGIALAMARPRPEVRSVEEQYLAVLRKEPASEHALVNLGNIYFHRGRIEDALEYYQRSLKSHPESAAASYNLSQAYKERFLFEEGSHMLQQAIRLDRKKVEAWLELSKRGPGYAVVNVPFDKQWIWEKTREDVLRVQAQADSFSTGLFGVSRSALGLMGLAWIFLFAVLSYVKTQTPLAYRCPSCEKIVCGWCRGSRFFGKICRECRAREKAGVIETERKRSRWRPRVFGFLAPGSVQIYRGFVWAGFFRMFFFFVACVGLLTPAFFYYPVPPTGGFQWLTGLWLAILILIYLSVLRELNIFKIRFNK